MPAAFIGHGSPMNALERNRYTDAWRDFGAACRGRAPILAISAHWYINATAVTAMTRPRTIHDFYGFPEELFAVDYPAPGLPELAEEIADVVHPTWVGRDNDSWGIDHGTWSVLEHAFPDAVDPGGAAVDQRRPATRLPPRTSAPTGAAAGRRHPDPRQRQHRAQPRGHATGIGRRAGSTGRSGSMTPRGPRCCTDRATSVDSPSHADFDAAVPTPDHFLPSVYFAGLAAAADRDRRRSRRRIHLRLAVDDVLHARLHRSPSRPASMARPRRRCRARLQPTPTSERYLASGPQICMCYAYICAAISLRPPRRAADAHFMSRGSDRAGDAAFSTEATRWRTCRRCECCARSSITPAAGHPSAMSPSTWPSSIRPPAEPWPPSSPPVC